jgi:hypothetical protein
MAITENDIAKVLKLVSTHTTLESLTETKDLDHLNKVSKNVVEKSIQNWYFSNGFQSLKSGWPYFLFWKKSHDGKTIY